MCETIYADQHAQPPATTPYRINALKAISSSFSSSITKFPDSISSYCDPRYQSISKVSTNVFKALLSACKSNHLFMIKCRFRQRFFFDLKAIFEKILDDAIFT